MQISQLNDYVFDFLKKTDMGPRMNENRTKDLFPLKAKSNKIKPFHQIRITFIYYIL